MDDIYLKINYGILSGEGEVKFVEDESKKLSYFKADIDLSLAKTLKRSPVQGLSLGVILGQSGTGEASYRFSRFSGGVETDVPIFNTGLAIKKMEAAVAFNALVNLGADGITPQKDNYGFRLGGGIGLIGTDFITLNGGMSVDYTIGKSLTATIDGDIKLDLSPYAEATGKAVAQYTFGTNQFTLDVASRAKIPADTGSVLDIGGTFKLETFMEESDGATPTSAEQVSNTSAYWKASGTVEGKLFGDDGGVFGDLEINSKTKDFKVGGAVYINASKPMKTGGIDKVGNHDYHQLNKGWIYDTQFWIRYSYDACMVLGATAENKNENKTFAFNGSAGAYFRGAIQYTADVAFLSVAGEAAIKIQLKGNKFTSTPGHVKTALDALSPTCRSHILNNGMATLNCFVNYGADSPSASIDIDGQALVTVIAGGEEFTFSHKIKDQITLNF